MPVKFFIRTGWGLLVLLSLFFIYNNAFRYFNFSSSAYRDDLKPFTGVLIVHITASLTALLTGPLQFIGSIRKRYTRFHRTTGYIYLVSVLIGATAGLYLAIFHAILTIHYLTFGTGLTGLGIAWLLTTGMALRAIKNKSYDQHREWMIRSYAVTCGFTTFRLIFGMMNKVLTLNLVDSISISAWACWALPLLITEVFIQSKKIVPATN